MKTISCLVLGSLFVISCADSTPKDVATDIVAEKVAAEHAPVQGPDLPAAPLPWSPGMPLPAERDCSTEATQTHVEVSWRPVESLANMVSRAKLVVKAHVTGRTYDVMRSYDNPKEGPPELGSDGQPIHADTPMTLVHYAVDELVSGDASMAGGQELTSLFAGGLMQNGCVVEPSDNPIPRLNERALLFVTPLGRSQLVLHKDTSAIVSVVGGVHGRLRIDGDKIGPIVPSAPAVAGIERFHGGPVQDLVSEVRRISATLVAPPGGSNP